MVRKEPIARWLATALAALFGIAVVLLPGFGCAVGEFEEHRDCSPSPLAWASLAVLAVAIVASRITRRPPVQWFGIGVAVVLASLGAGRAG